MRPMKDIELRYSNDHLDRHMTEKELADAAAGFGEVALTCLWHVLAEPGPNANLGWSPETSRWAETHALEAIAGEARAAAHFGLLALERIPTADPDPKTCDVIVENHGNLFLFRPRTDAGFAWLKEHTTNEPWQWFGSALAVEPRYAGELVCGIEDAGLAVR